MADEYNVRYQAFMIDKDGKQHQKYCTNKVSALAWARKLKAKELVIKTRNGQTLVEYKRGK